MEEIFSFHKKLNIKKLVIAIIISLILIFVLAFTFYNINQTSNVEQQNSSHTIFADITSSISIELPKTYGLSLFNSNSNYILETRSSNNLKVLISHLDSLEHFSFDEIIKSDKENYLKKFTNTSNISEITETTKNEKKSCSYSFNYQDENLSETYFLQVIWIDTENGYYIIDIQYPISDAINYSNITDEILTSFKLNNEISK